VKFLLDPDVYALTARHLQALGHTVVTAYSLGLSQADDGVLLATAQERGSLFVTRDRDFGSLAFVERKGAGIMYLRVLPATVRAVHEELTRVLATYSEEQLKQGFVVVEPGRHRFRRIS
jgi:predicted nuclease of predicted toxin-antitoxin system